MENKMVKTKVYWLPLLLWLITILVWLNGNISNFLKPRVSALTFYTWNILAVYSTLLIITYFCYTIITNEIELQKEIKSLRTRRK